MRFFELLRGLAGVAAASCALGSVPAAAETVLNMAVVSRTVFYLPAWMAEKQGFFRQEGLDVRMKVYDSSDPIFVDLRKGEQQIAVASIESVIADAYKGGKVRIVAGSAKRPPHFIIAQPEITSRWPSSRARPSASCRCTRAPRSSSPISPGPAASRSPT
jgi:ABC-type nitrate/sulfonate/bicarbonate transport system substrate-binding protein